MILGRWEVGYAYPVYLLLRCQEWRIELSKISIVSTQINGIDILACFSVEYLSWIFHVGRKENSEEGWRQADVELTWVRQDIWIKGIFIAT